ncbi:oxygen-dependent protoporphyrinogen oxidase [Irineochytrium annulatum]|nr:oxygen-dependent protoporphyrinogen oxidase [Irineochytrium annulatum]
MTGPVIILGGGISGLSAAWFLAKSAPKTLPITVVESTSRFGGWIQTKLEGGTVFELGPRTLRPVGDAGTITLDMIYRLGLSDQILTVARSSPAAKNRFILHGGRLNMIPSSLMSAIADRPPVLKGAMTAIIREPFKPKGSGADESIHDFVTRRFSESVATNLISAMVHGIYAGDARKLSVRSTFPMLWQAERDYGSVVKGLLRANSSAPPDTLASAESLAFINEMKQCSVYSFKLGLQSLSDAIVRDLSNHSNVELKLDTAPTALHFTNFGVKVETKSQTFEGSHVVSAATAKSVSPLLPKPLQGLLNSISYVDVAVVNLAFPKQELGVNGFGFLVPRNEPADVLGVVLDSCTLPEQDEADVTRVTAMLGGHMFFEKFGDPGTVSHARLEALAIETARKHLGLTGDPVKARVTIQRNCIPQYLVGHRANLRKVHDEISGSCFGRLSLIGSSFMGVSVNDCVKSGKTVADALCTGVKPITGLEATLE